MVTAAHRAAALQDAYGTAISYTGATQDFKTKYRQS